MICLPVLFIICTVLAMTSVMGTDYCNVDLCYGYGRHIGCGNNGVGLTLKYVIASTLIDFYNKGF